jgi:hypothetical protein
MIFSKMYTAVGAIPKFRLVKYVTSDTQVTLAVAATDQIIGVTMGPSDAADTDQVEVCLLGECFVEVSGAIGRGGVLTANASGQGVPPSVTVGVNSRIIGWAMISGTSTNIPVFVVPSHFQG